MEVHTFINIGGEQYGFHHVSVGADELGKQLLLPAIIE